MIELKEMCAKAKMKINRISDGAIQDALLDILLIAETAASFETCNCSDDNPCDDCAEFCECVDEDCDCQIEKAIDKVIVEQIEPEESK
jgi:hypothetical protein